MNVKNKCGALATLAAVGIGALVMASSNANAAEWFNGSMSVNGECWTRNDTVRAFGYWKPCAPASRARAVRSAPRARQPVAVVTSQREWFNGNMHVTSPDGDVCWKRNDSVRAFGYWS